MRQVIILLAIATVVSAKGYGQPFHSKKNVEQKQQHHQFASVTSYHSNKPAAPQMQAAPLPQQQAIPYMQAAPLPQQQAAPSPYSFGYEAEGSARQESADSSGKVTGSYTVTNEDGSVRVVKYVADEQGFRADVDTNEAGTKSSNPANVEFKSAFVEPAAPSQPAPKKYAAPQVSSYAGQYEQKPVQFNLGSDAGAYSFNYEAQLEDGGSSARRESADTSGQVSGQYSLSASDGRRRQVDYSSGAGGFQAKIETNEFGTKSDSPAHVQFYSSAPQPAAAAPSASSGYSKMNSFQQQKQATSYAATPVRQEPIQAAKFASASVNQQPIQDYAQPSPYAFSYDAQLEDGSSSSRTESADASGKVVGSYSLATADGRQRTVHYTADHEGFRSSIDTNEFGTKSDSPADVQFKSNAPQEAPAASTYNAGHAAGQFGQQRIPAAFPVEQKHMSAGSQVKTAYQAQSSSQGQSAMQYGGADSYAPFSFNYVAELEDGSSSRSESGDGSGKVTGSYSLSAKDGRKRTVDYLADHSGFRATVNTNEFGTKSDSPADIQFYSSAPQEAPQAPSAPAYMATKDHFKSGGSASQYKASAGQFHSGASASQYSSGQSAFASQQKVEAQPSYQPSPYSFGYEADATGGSSARSESSDANGKVTGSYTVRNEDGSQRVVEYVADKDGFRANVKTNEPGTKSDDPAHVVMKSDAPAVSAPLQQQKYAGKASFPAPTYSQKSSMVSQKAVEPWRR